MRPPAGRCMHRPGSGRMRPDLPDDAEHPAHERVDPAEVRVRPRPEGRRGAPRDLVDRGRPDAELARVIAACAIRERIRDACVQAARVLARGDAVEDRAEVRLPRRDAGDPRGYRASVIVDELDRLALRYSRDATAC